MSSVLNSYWSVVLREWIASPFAIVVIACLVGYMAFNAGRCEHPTYDDEDYVKEGHIFLPEPLRNLRLTKQMLKEYSSDNPKFTYLVALHGTIYDVSSAPIEFGPYGTYAELSGSDILCYLQTLAIIEERAVDSVVNEWKTMLEDHFYEAGVLESEEAEVAESTEDHKKAEDAITADVEVDDDSIVWNDIDETVIPGSSSSLKI